MFGLNVQADNALRHNISLDPVTLASCTPPPSIAASVGSVLSLGITESNVFPSMLNFAITSNASVGSSYS